MNTLSTCERPAAERAASGPRTRTATQAQALPSGLAASRQVIVSNRLPYRADVDETGKVALTRSTGGLATALGPLHERSGNLWIGWAEDAGERDAAVAVRMDAALAERACMPIHLDEGDAALYYEGFSNSTLWPLFHGFPQNARFDQKAWEAYVRVNERFRDAVVAVARPGDVVWIQDYHLMLLPSLVRAAMPETQVGFFLHVPFPDYETFRMLPWREELVRGMLGADLIGFHAYDYVRHFLSSCRRIAGLENRTGTLTVEGRLAQADAFPLGIDYERFRQAALAPAAQATRSEFADGTGRRTGHGGCKTMLSVERLDYSKGVPERLRAYRAFLGRHPEWRGRVVLVLVTVPSRENVAPYQALKAEIDELVGQVNGEFATLSWTPIDYYYRSLAFESLVALYAASDVMLVTPLRDGMNLVCKEYLACHDGGGGVLVLSEMAGAAYELQEALTVNPFDQEGLIRAIERALTMPEDEQRRRNAPMQQRLARYTSQKWSCEFLDALADVKSRQKAQHARLLGASTARGLLGAFSAARRRAILLDYDGTLMPFCDDPTQARPDQALIDLLRRLGSCEDNAVVVVSGRDRDTLEKWLGGVPVGLVAEHGAWLRGRPCDAWQPQGPMPDGWKDDVRTTLTDFVDRTPGSFLEEKDCSLVWHYRACSPEVAERRVIEVKGMLSDSLANRGLALMDGNKVVEVKPRGADKGRAAHRWLTDPSFDFLLAAGDDRTDEDVFETAPEGVWTIHVGDGPTAARFALKSPREMRELLEALARRSA